MLGFLLQDNRYRSLVSPAILAGLISNLGCSEPSELTGFTAPILPSNGDRSEAFSCINDIISVSSQENTRLCLYFANAPQALEISAESACDAAECDTRNWRLRSGSDTPPGLNNQAIIPFNNAERLSNELTGRLLFSTLEACPSPEIGNSVDCVGSSIPGSNDDDDRAPCFAALQLPMEVTDSGLSLSARSQSEVSLLYARSFVNEVSEGTFQSLCSGVAEKNPGGDARPAVVSVQFVISGEEDCSAREEELVLTPSDTFQRSCSGENTLYSADIPTDTEIVASVIIPADQPAGFRWADDAPCEADASPCSFTVDGSENPLNINLTISSEIFQLLVNIDPEAVTDEEDRTSTRVEVRTRDSQQQCTYGNAPCDLQFPFGTQVTLVPSSENGTTVSMSVPWDVNIPLDASNDTPAPSCNSSECKIDVVNDYSITANFAEGIFPIRILADDNAQPANGGLIEQVYEDGAPRPARDPISCGSLVEEAPVCATDTNTEFNRVELSANTSGETPGTRMLTWRVNTEGADVDCPDYSELVNAGITDQNDTCLLTNITNEVSLNPVYGHRLTIATSGNGQGAVRVLPTESDFIPDGSSFFIKHGETVVIRPEAGNNNSTFNGWTTSREPDTEVDGSNELIYSNFDGPLQVTAEFTCAETVTVGFLGRNDGALLAQTTDIRSADGATFGQLQCNSGQCSESLPCTRCNYRVACDSPIFGVASLDGENSPSSVRALVDGFPNCIGTGCRISNFPGDIAEFYRVTVASRPEQGIIEFEGISVQDPITPCPEGNGNCSREFRFGINPIVVTYSNPNNENFVWEGCDRTVGLQCLIDSIDGNRSLSLRGGDEATITVERPGQPGLIGEINLIDADTINTDTPTILGTCPANTPACSFVIPRGPVNVALLQLALPGAIREGFESCPGDLDDEDRTCIIDEINQDEVLTATWRPKTISFIAEAIGVDDLDVLRTTETRVFSPNAACEIDIIYDGEEGDIPSCSVTLETVGFQVESFPASLLPTEALIEPGQTEPVIVNNGIGTFSIPLTAEDDVEFRLVWEAISQAED